MRFLELKIRLRNMPEKNKRSNVEQTEDGLKRKKSEYSYDRTYLLKWIKK